MNVLDVLYLGETRYLSILNSHLSWALAHVCILHHMTRGISIKCQGGRHLDHVAPPCPNIAVSGSGINKDKGKGEAKGQRQQHHLSPFVPEREKGNSWGTARVTLAYRRYQVTDNIVSTLQLSKRLCGYFSFTL